MQRSTDGGLTFRTPSLVIDDNNINIFNDKNWIAVDSSPASPHYGRVYSMWSRFITTGSGSSAVTTNPGAVSFSDDHGKTYELQFQSDGSPIMVRRIKQSPIGSQARRTERSRPRSRSRWTPWYSDVVTMSTNA